MGEHVILKIKFSASLKMKIVQLLYTTQCQWKSKFTKNENSKDKTEYPRSDDIFSRI